MIIDHLISRHMDISKYHVFIDDENNVATFPLWNLSGQMVGYQQYNPASDKKKKNDPKESRYYTYTTKIEKSNMIGVWGLETVTPYYDFIFITEGIFDAVRLHNLNLPAIALLSCDPKHLKNWFFMINKTLFSIGDGDDSGNKLAKFCDLYYSCPPDKDLADLSDAQIIEILKYFGIEK